VLSQADHQNIMTTSSFNYDHVIVGAGSAGCVLANRLSADPHARVLLLEAGPRDRNIFLKIPAGISRVYVHDRLNWGYSTEPEPNLGGRSLYWPRGKTLGGSSAINGMIYIRGQAEDFDRWAQLGNSGWDWNSVLPLFKRLECNDRGADAFHGDAGELHVTDPRFRHPTSQAFIEAARAAGVPFCPDFNGATQLGVNFYQFTIRNGVRHSSATAFLQPVRRWRTNLTVHTGAHVTKLEFRHGRVAAVTYSDGSGQRRVGAGEVILCAGAINSPQLLMLSGIGPASQLRGAGIPVIADVPGVGENLQDHLYVQHLSTTADSRSVNRSMRGWRLLPAALRYITRRDGLLTLAASQAAAFVKSSAELSRPDLQIMFKPYTLQMSPDAAIVPDPVPGLSTLVCPLRPGSRGALRLRNADPRAAPLLYPNYLSDAADLRKMIEGLRQIRQIFAARPMANIAREADPGDTVDSDAALAEFVRAKAQSMFHPVGTCKMGTDALAVVDSRLRVRGVQGLRVADASIMPEIVSGNTNAASIMIGEKAADLIIEDSNSPGTSNRGIPRRLSSLQL
jgi:choline dehydrogenase